MKLKKDGPNYVIAVDMNEDLFASLLGLAVQEKIEAAEISAIGAIKDFELGYYYIDKKEYKRQSFKEIVELLGCNGNLAIREGKPFLHLHVVLGREDFSVIGGHLFTATVAVTAEVQLHPLKEGVHRSYDATTGLYLLDLPFCKTL